MPHRVANFLRTSSGNIVHIKKKTTPAAAAASSSTSTSGPSSCTSSAAPSRNSSISLSPYASDSDDHHHHHHHHHHAVKVPEHLADAIKRQHHRLSLPFGRASSKERHAAAAAAACAAAALDCRVESPPLVYHGSAEDSTGALLSAQLFLDCNDDAVEVEALTASLRLRTLHKRPHQGHCHDCQLQERPLGAWELLSQPASLRRGRHAFPFSTLLAGHLPPSMDTPVVAVSYELRAEAVVVASPGAPPRTLRLERTLPVKRSLPEPLYPHHSVRVFPPTNIKAAAHYSTVVHPTPGNRLALRLDGLMTHNDKVRTVDLWKLKKVTWKLEETIKTTAPACDRHAGGAGGGAGGSGSGRGASGSASTGGGGGDDDDHHHHHHHPPPRGTLRTETRVIGEKQLHDGWKADYSGSDGTVDLELDYGVNQYAGAAKAHHARELKYACDVRAADGTEVTHSLQIELIVSKEYAPEGRPQLAAQTGTGRILRMHFAVSLAELPGLGVSWDNEAPPVYQDVPPSPPGYTPARGPPAEYEALEAMEAR